MILFLKYEMRILMRFSLNCLMLTGVSVLESEAVEDDVISVGGTISV
jgi:hypothetical protein